MSSVALSEYSALVEGERCDFKRQLDLDDEKARRDILDDVVAFLNRGAARIVIGVEEARGAFKAARPMPGDPDAWCRRLQDILHANIDPRPLDVSVTWVEHDGGFLADVCIPVHRAGPYQNRLTGGFKRRVGAKNVTMTPGELSALFVSAERCAADLTRLAAAQAQKLSASGMMDARGAFLELNILAQDHYAPDRAVFDPGRMQLKPAPGFLGRAEIFKGAQGGCEAVWVNLRGSAAERLFVSDDWLIHAHVTHPMWVRSGTLQLQLFGDNLAGYLKGVQDFLLREGLKGPFYMQLALRDLHRSDELARYFPRVREVALTRPRRTHDVADMEIVEQFCFLVRRSTIWG